MAFIDSRFKECDPITTVNNIKKILDDLDIKITEKHYESGIENCKSLTVMSGNGLPSSTGKGISEEFARASAYAEFIERLSSGLYTVRYTSIFRDPDIDFHSYAPDGKYMTVEELLEDCDWLDLIVDSYKDPYITRDSIVDNCKAYACADDGRILTVPFYSLFEDKYIYLPIAFVSRMYSANGSCAGNSREEAWVHALSEILERNSSRAMVMSGKALPKISDTVLEKFPTVSKIIKKIRNTGHYEVDVFDCSMGTGFPVIASRVINKENQAYTVNVGADPILEIAIQRSFTELFQGRAISDLKSVTNSIILSKITDFPVASNVLNHTHNSRGIYTADFFANELTCGETATDFPDNTNKTNKELLTEILDIYKQLGKQVYIRNYSYLGFHSYKIVVPGISESRSVCLNEFIPEHSLADETRETFKNVTKASDDDLSLMLSYCYKIKSVFRQYDFFSSNSGIPLAGGVDFELSHLTRAYAQYRLGNFLEAIKELVPLAANLKNENNQYFKCINMYLQLKNDRISDDKIRSIIYKFFVKEYADQLYDKLDKGLSPYDDYLLKCEITNCEGCRYSNYCCYDGFRKLTAKVGAIYKTFVNGQDRSEFKL